MTARFLKHNWTDKPQIPRDAVFASLILILIVIAFFKLKPYFTEKQKVVAFSGNGKSVNTSRETEKLLKQHELAEDPSHKGGSHISNYPGYRSQSDHLGESANTRGIRIVERPLFDGLTVTLQTELTNGFSSAQGDSSVEARIIGIIPDENASIDPSAADGATIVGSAATNFDLKRVNIQFSELVTREGRRYPVTAVAVDPEAKSLGIAAHYSSGTISRLFGVGLTKALGVTDGYVKSRILENSKDSDVIRRELSRTATDTGGQAASDLGNEATKDLRETKPELHLDAGTRFTVRLKATGQGGER